VKHVVLVLFLLVIFYIPYHRFPMYSYIKIIDVDGKYIILFIGCKIFFVFDIVVVLSLLSV